MFDKLMERISSMPVQLHGICVSRGGERVFYHCPGGEVRHPVYSVTKSFTSAAFMLAADDGLVTEDTPLAELLESRYRSMVPQGMAKLPLSRYMTMRAGKYPFRPEGNDWLEWILSLGTDYSDSGYCYSNIPAYLVGAALENAVGGDLGEYLRRRLLDPLGIPDPVFASSPEGHFYGATGMKLSLSELAAVGQLFLQKGEWQGSRLISRSSVEKAVAPYVDTGFGDCYGYFFRVAEDHYSMVGKWGQRCMVYPEQDLVIAYLSHSPDCSDELYHTVRDFAKQYLCK